MEPVVAPTGPEGPEEVVRIATREMSLRVFEAEVLVRAAGWILVLRGTGFGLAAAVGAIALRRQGLGSVGPIAAVLIGFAQAAIGAGLLRRARWAWMALPVEVFVWASLMVALMIPQMYGARSMLQLLRADPVTRLLLPSFILPDLFAVFAAYRAEGRKTSGGGHPPLIPLGSAWRVHPTGKVLVALGMTTLAALSMAASLLFGPGFLLA